MALDRGLRGVLILGYFEVDWVRAFDECLVHCPVSLFGTGFCLDSRVFYILQSNQFSGTEDVSVLLVDEALDSRCREMQGGSFKVGLSPGTKRPVPTQPR